MSRLSVSCLALGSFLAGTAVMFTAPQLIPEAQAGKFVISEKWEYKAVLVNVQKLEEVNALGAQGWELVVEESTGWWVLKRRVP